MSERGNPTMANPRSLCSLYVLIHPPPTVTTHRPDRRPTSEPCRRWRAQSRLRQIASDRLSKVHCLRPTAALSHFSKRLSGAGPLWQRRAKLAPIVGSHVRNLTKSRHGLLWWIVDIAEGPIGPSFDRRPECRVTRHHGVFQPLPQLRPLSARLPYLDGDRRRLLSDDDDEPLATGSQWPRAFTRRTQKPLSSLWKVTRSTRPARPSQSGHPEYLIVRPTQE